MQSATICNQKPVSNVFDKRSSTAESVFDRRLLGVEISNTSASIKQKCFVRFLLYFGVFVRSFRDMLSYVV